MTLSATRRRTGCGLFGDIDHAATAFAEALHQFVAAERLAHGFVRRVGHIELDGGLDGGMLGDNSSGASCAASSASSRWRKAGSPPHMAIQKCATFSAGFSSASANSAASRSWGDGMLDWDSLINPTCAFAGLKV